MTPGQARALLDGTTPGPWEWREGKDQNGEFVALSGPDSADALRTWDGDLYASGVHGTNADKALAAAAPTLAAMIAGMREEWGAERQVRGRWVRIVFALNTIWTDDRAITESAVDDCRDLGLPARIVRRYVTTEEEIS